MKESGIIQDATNLNEKNRKLTIRIKTLEAKLEETTASVKVQPEARS